MSRDREAFMRMMGITNDDVVDPGLRRGSSDATPAPKPAGRGPTPRSGNVSGAPSPTLSSGASMPGADLTAKRRAFLAELGLNEAGVPLPSARAGPAGGGASHPAGAGGGSPTERLKAAGNNAFERGAFVEATRHYTDAIEVGKVSRADPVLMAALYSNRSASYLQGAKQMASVETAYDHALCDADEAVALRPDWFKGYSRQGDVCFKMRRFHQAAEAYAMALHLQPGNVNLANSLKESQERALSTSREEWQSRRNCRKQQQQQPHSLNASGTYRSSAASSSGEPMTPGSLGYDEGGECSPSLNTTSNLAKSGAPTAGGGRSATDMWSELKEEVRRSAPESLTGDDYRRQQLERYRQLREAKTQQLFGSGAGAASTAAGQAHEGVPVHEGSPRGAYGPMDSTTPLSGGASGPGRAGADSSANAGQRVGSQVIPSEFSSSAASAYQQRLLEQFRQRKMMA